MSIIYKEEKDCWCSLQALKDFEVSNNNITVEDFNMILNSKEKRGGSIVKDPFREKMEDHVMDWDLVDVKLMKGKYTWLNIRIRLGHIATILDHFLI